MAPQQHAERHKQLIACARRFCVYFMLQFVARVWFNVCRPIRNVRFADDASMILVFRKKSGQITERVHTVLLFHC